MGTCGSKHCKEEEEEEVDAIDKEIESIDKEIAAKNKEFVDIIKNVMSPEDFDKLEPLQNELEVLQNNKLRLFERKVKDNSKYLSKYDSKSDSNLDKYLELELSKLMNKEGGKKSRRKQTRGKKSRRKQTRGKKSRRKQKGGYTQLEEDFREFVLDTQTPETKIDLEDIDKIYHPDSGKLDELLKTDITKIQKKLAAQHRAYSNENTILIQEKDDLEKQNIKKKIEIIKKLILISSYIIKFKSIHE